MIKVENLKKSFDDRAVVRDLSLEARDGEITGLLGSNGAGKTTTLRMICGALTPEVGDVFIDQATERTERQRRVGALLDHIGIYSRLTVRENLEYFGKLRGMQGRQLAERVTEVISILGMESIARRRTAGFSQGERMKVALGRAILHSPKNLLLDEPTNGLDIPAVRSLRDFLRRLRESGVCVLFSSHVLEEVRSLCDRVVVISDGRSIAHGSPAELCTETETGSLEDAFVKLTNQQESCAC